ncbi:Holliday junction branch migration protein RuvA [Bacillus solimangrovi]|uniref:Holliday junction branch migration protein RuvA n=1 Tax=Bacillus solimangrovi TaxID=1305675 RepID=UPI000AC78A88|nr:Holliday junction branch migration protein RuvA [Bacillus solimangrovi]
MIAFVTGTVEFVSPEAVIIDHNGMGYEVYCPNPFVFQSKLNERVKVYTYQYVREDTLALYGFETREEKALFNKLLNVSGIGPKGALAILASGEPHGVVQAIEQEDDKYLTKFPGVGKKTARQMILDLKGKLDDLFPDALPNLFNPEQKQSLTHSSEQLEEALEALKVLGYSERELKKVVPKLAEKEQSTDQYVKDALRLLLK